MIAASNSRTAAAAVPERRGSVLIIVLWIAFGLVVLALYFAQSMLFELRAVDQRVAGAQAEQAIAGATYYVSNVLAGVETPGTRPDVTLEAWEAVPIGEATVWFIGRGTPIADDQPVFDLADEASKLDLNTATQDMLAQLPRMTEDLAAAIIDWRDTDDDVSTGGAETDTYQQLRPGPACSSPPPISRSCAPSSRTSSARSAPARSCSRSAPTPATSAASSSSTRAAA